MGNKQRFLLFVVPTLLQACGGGGASNSAGSSTLAPGTNTPSAANAQPISVDHGPANSTNTAFTSVTVCIPGTTACQTVDHIIVDTGSSGLRIVSSVLAPSSAFPQQVDANGAPLAECAQFADGFSWGPLKTADVKIASETAASMSIQLIDNSLAIPGSCSSTGAAEQTVQALGGNGILGIGVFVHDCGAACALQALPGNYYTCPVGGCQPIARDPTLQVQNPVASFAGDNNGTIIRLPAVPAGGLGTVQGSLIFGIDTQANNTLGSATVFSVDPQTGDFATLYKNQTYQSFVDTGSNGLFFPDSAIPVCTGAPGFYCPSTPLNLSATIQGTNGVAAAVSFSVANATTLFSNGNDAAFSNLAGTSTPANNFDWGLPFFFSRTVFTAIEGRNTSRGPGPYFAY
jgi:Protein of unknown function (DUF3443)